LVIDIPRISFEQLPEELRSELEAKYRRLGYLGEFFQVAAHQPEALLHFNRFTETLKEALPENLVEMLALTLSTWSGNDYERVQHERLALKFKHSEAWIRDVERLAPDGATLLSTEEKVVQRLALAMAKTQGRDAYRAAEACRELCSADRVVGIMLTVGRYLAHSAICNTLRFTPPVASPLAGRP
jgi:alkylhydroperoxidase family enzyme